MNPLAFIYGKQKIKDNDLYLAQCLPLMHKRLMLQGKSSNLEIDVLFELCYRIIYIASASRNDRMGMIAMAAQKALVAACDTAADKCKLTIDPSTDQKRTICTALDLLATIAPQLTNETYFKACAYGADKLSHYVKLREERIAA